MTGEITLRGKVLPVGGIKDKVLAAYRTGIRDVILPAENEKDLEDIPEDVRTAMQYHLVREMDEVVALALDGELPAAAGPSSEAAAAQGEGRVAH
jgi:ATP-dependent Lon protease